MQAISTALNRVFADGVWFLRAREIRLWVVRTTADLRKPALQVVTGMDYMHGNKSAWVTLPDGHTTIDPGWHVRANRLIDHWSDLRKAFLEKEAIEMPEARLGEKRASDPGEAVQSSPAAPMWDACAAFGAAIRPPLDGAVILLAPAIVDDVNALGAEIEALVNDPALSGFRWVLVLDAESPWPDALDRFGERAIRSECSADPYQQKKDFAALLTAAPTMIGRAGPRGVTPPRRVTDPPPMPAEERAAALRANGINPEYLERAPELQRLILGAAIAMKEGQSAEAVRQQQAAGELAFSLELYDVTVLCRVALSAYLMASGRSPEALSASKSAAELARGRGFLLQEAQARLSIGLLLALAEQYDQAADAYAESARCAEAAKTPALAIEAWRMAGQVSLQVPNREKACECFRAAIRVAVGTEVGAVQASTAPESARKLAAICDELGMRDQAESLRIEAEAMETGDVGIKPGPALVEA